MSAPAPAVQPGGTLTYDIIGGDSQLLQVVLAAGEEILCCKDRFIFCGAGVKLSPDTQAGWGLLALLKTIGPEGEFAPRKWSNTGTRPAYIGIGTAFTGKIIPFDLSVAGPIVIASDNFVACSAQATIAAKRYSLGRSGSMVMRRIGGAGTCFIHAGGAAVEKQLHAMEVMFVDSCCLVGFTESCGYSSEVSGAMAAMFGGNRLAYNCKITGPGTVWVQSMSLTETSGRLWASGRRGTADLRRQMMVGIGVVG
ncbi:unnamed protein product [Chrysoparadoxa australica]